MRSTQPGVGGGGQDALELLGQLLAREGGQLDAGGRRVARELGEQRPQRVAAVQLVGAVGADASISCWSQSVRDRKLQEASGWSCRPSGGPRSASSTRLLLGERVEQRQQRLEDARLRGVAAVRARSPKPGSMAASAARSGSGQRVEGRVPSRSSGPQRADQRGVGELALAELDAVADEHERARLARPAEQLAGQARLADAGLAGDQRQRRTAGRPRRERGLELGELRRIARRSGRLSYGWPSGAHPPTRAARRGLVDAV